MIMTKTAWNTLSRSASYPKLKTDIDVDVAIIGAGLAGMATAYFLAKSGKRVAVLEADAVGKGATSYTTAFITQVVDTSLSELADMFGTSQAKMVWRSHAAAIDTIEEIIKAEGIDCEFLRCPAYVYAATEDQRADAEDEAKTAKKFGFDAEWKSESDLGFNTYGYMEVGQQAKFHPLKFLYGLTEKAVAQGVLLFEKTEAKDISGRGPYKVTTEYGSVRADCIVVATYDPFNNPRQTFAKKGMYSSYVLEIELPKNTFEEALYWDQSNPYNYFRIDRMADCDRMIFGGADHREELPVSSAKNFKALENYLKNLLGETKYKIIRKWDGPILEPSDGLALIGEYKKDHFIASAFSGNGMTYSFVASMLLSDLIRGKKNKWASVYDPTRPRKISRYLKKAVEYGEEFIGGAVKNTLRY
jgi:glycine/D-amino acid oxidase-like deaminating enzyme